MTHEGKTILESMENYEKLELAREGCHNPFVDTMKYFVYLFLHKMEAKRRCILLHGLANSGKTTLLNFFKEIFDAYDERTTGQRFGIQMKTR